MKIYLLCIFLLIYSLQATSRILETGAWNTFEGRIGERDSQLSLYLFKDGSVKGNFVFKNTANKIAVNGYSKANTIILTETNNKKTVFKGNIFTAKTDSYIGIYHDAVSNISINFNFTLSTITWGEYANMYTDLLGTNTEIEEFALQIKTSILTNNRQWLSDHIQFPTAHVLKQPGLTIIKSKTQFLKHYDEIFDKKFKDKIREVYTTNLFNKNGQVMLGNGELWIGNSENSTSKRYEFIIVAINP